MGELTEAKVKAHPAQLKDMAKEFTKKVEEALNDLIDGSIYWEDVDGEGDELTDKEVIDMVKLAVKGIKWNNIQY